MGEDLSFDVDGEACAAWLYRPPGGEAITPVVVMAHGLSGTRRDRLGPFAERFAAAGLAALLFDHRGFGDSEGEEDLFLPARQLEDWEQAIANARSLPGIDPTRVATFGSSIGGGNALAAAARDPGVAAVVSQVPFIDIWRQAHRSPLAVTARAVLAAARGGHLPAIGQPDEAAFINAPGGEEGWRRVVAWLLCVGEADRVARPGPAIAAARRAPRSELRSYPGVDHFDIYDGPELEAVVTDEIEFLRRHLL